VQEVVAELGLEARFLVMGMRDGDASGRVASDTVDVLDIDSRTLLSPTGCWAAIGDQDCILDIGAGDSFAEIYGFKRFGFLWLTKMMCAFRGVPLLLSPQTIGPFSRTPYTQLARLALKRASAVVVRDAMSLDALRRLAPSANGVLSVDVAFALPYEDHSHLRGGPRLRVGVNVSGLLFNAAESGANRFGLDFHYAELMRLLIVQLTARSDVEVHLIAHVVDPSGWDDDGGTADQLSREYPRAIRVPNFAGPSEAKSYISGLDFVVAGRMHACIAAFSTGVPVVPIAYSRKFTGLFNLLDYAWLVDVTGADTHDALAYLTACLERRCELARDVDRGMKRVGSLLAAYRSELRMLLAEVAKGR
jgi:polysaccharide pyruvyl transferase WcaK-like protein